MILGNAPLTQASHVYTDRAGVTVESSCRSAAESIAASTLHEGHSFTPVQLLAICHTLVDVLDRWNSGYYTALETACVASSFLHTPFGTH